MKRTIVNSGDRYGRLTIISEAPTIFHKHGSTRRFNCLCDCGNIKEISLCSLKGTTKSCGCQNKEWVKQGNSNRKHGDSSKLSEHNYIYATWRAIRQRCYDPNAMNYHNYGGRGISCFWKNDYTGFKKYILENIGERPEGCSIDRINNDKNYEPGNLRWLTNSEQQLNKRCNTKMSAGN